MNKKTAIILVNLGSPDMPTPKYVRKFLREFLSDPRVVEIPKPLWWLILNGIVLLIRPKRSAMAYQKIWSPTHGSPLIYYTRRQADQLQAHFSSDTIVLPAMRYGQPSLKHAFQQCLSKGIDKILIFPLYPQYSATTTASVIDEVGKLLRQQRNLPSVRYIKSYYQHPLYIEAMAEKILRYWQENGKSSQILFSFHGIPEYCVKKGDPYSQQCKQTALLLAEALSLSPTEWKITFQSRFGPAKWLQPYTDKTLIELAANGVRSVDIFCPGFASDCLETLEEIAIEGKAAFIEAGGENLRYIPALNCDNKHIETLANIAASQIHKWQVY